MTKRIHQKAWGNVREIGAYKDASKHLIQSRETLSRLSHAALATSDKTRTRFCLQGFLIFILFSLLERRLALYIPDIFIYIALNIFSL